MKFRTIAWRVSILLTDKSRFILQIAIHNYCKIMVPQLLGLKVR
jgi:hypothetical protein